MLQVHMCLHCTVRTRCTVHRVPLLLPVDIRRQIGMVGVVLDELVEHPGGGGGADPLPGVDTAVDPGRRLVAAPPTTHLQYISTTVFENHNFFSSLTV